ncbi:MAG: bifunctional methylenetetrahydrofolate dehydrogenase/methenyltetrahydrofolate cyclohydrolase FolD [Candidatus Obscuribacterales bacterium]|nr:bifunctional methylenetetrahydrofolate dehydrogenase/methenyltetrahydrofolate cyclohydrolase FolD [Candidatus Obscuribacterales bacterium]
MTECVDDANKVKSKASKIDGKAVAQAVKERLKEEIQAQVQAHDNLSAGKRRPGLAVVLVGEDPASQTYVKNKISSCEEVGIVSFHHRLAADVSQLEVQNLVRRLNADEAVDGILVQLPLPAHIDTREVLSLIDPDKDVDGLSAVNQGRLAIGEPGLFPCTPLGVMELLRYEGVELKGKHAVVVGRSALVGKPVALMLLAKDATVTVCHSRTSDLPAVCRSADVLVAAVGRANMIKGSWIKPGAVVIDVGINRIEVNGKGKLVGDVDYNEAVEVASKVTPVPGGVGPMTVAMLLSNTFTSYKRR